MAEKIVDYYRGSYLQDTIDVNYPDIGKKTYTGYKPIIVSNQYGTGKNIEMPLKGDLITIEDKQYRVLKTDGNIAEVLAMYNAADTQAFNASNSNIYNGSDLDIYLNNTFYNTLSSNIKNAIIQKQISQEIYTYNDSNPGNATYSYLYRHDSTDIDYATLNATAIIGNRNIYALNLSDIFEYVNSTYISCSDLMLMWFNQEVVGTKTYVWLRSSNYSNSTYGYLVNAELGGMNTNLISVKKEYAARPAFQIDLSKIEFTKEE